MSPFRSQASPPRPPPQSKSNKQRGVHNFDDILTLTRNLESTQTGMPYPGLHYLSLETCVDLAEVPHKQGTP